MRTTNILIEGIRNLYLFIVKGSHVTKSLLISNNKHDKKRSVYFKSNKKNFILLV